MIEAAKRGERRDQIAEPVQIRRGDEDDIQHAGAERVDVTVAGETRRSIGLVLSAEIERAKRAAAAGTRAQQRLAKLQDEAVMALLGIERGKLFSQLWRHQMAKVADALSVSSSHLRDICELYDVPTPPPGYWLTKPERRGVRVLDHAAVSPLRGNA